MNHVFVDSEGNSYNVKIKGWKKGNLILEWGGEEIAVNLDDCDVMIKED